MNTKLKIQNLQPSNSPIELNTAELGQVIGGRSEADQERQQKLIDVLLSSDVNHGEVNGFQFTQISKEISGIEVQQRVDENGALQTVSPT